METKVKFKIGAGKTNSQKATINSVLCMPCDVTRYGVTEIQGCLEDIN